jgi:hypothetical protein
MTWRDRVIFYALTALVLARAAFSIGLLSIGWPGGSHRLGSKKAEQTGKPCGALPNNHEPV